MYGKYYLPLNTALKRISSDYIHYWMAIPDRFCHGQSRMLQKIQKGSHEAKHKIVTHGLGYSREFKKIYRKEDGRYIEGMLKKGYRSCTILRSKI